MPNTDDYETCYECRGLGDDYGFDEDGELVNRCSDCPCNPVSIEELRYEMMDWTDDESEVSSDGSC